MNNQELSQTMIKREQAQKALMVSLGKLQGISPMSLLTGGFSSLDGVVAQLESVAHLNDKVVTELATRALNNG